MKYQSLFQINTLREHEIQILEFLMSGNRLINIAAHYEIPIRAVRAYLRIIFRKIGKRSGRVSIRKNQNYH